MSPRKHVEQLRQFVEAQTPQQNADQRAARIAALGPNRSGALFGVDAHRAKFEHHERLAAQAGPLLRDTGPGRGW